MPATSIFQLHLLNISQLFDLAAHSGLNLPNLYQLWPSFIILGGLYTLWQFFKNLKQNASFIFIGLTALGIGAFFFIFSLDIAWPLIGRIRWSDMEMLWPLFLVISASAFIGELILTGFRKLYLLFPGCLSLLMGLSILPVTMGIVRGAWLYPFLDFWPLVLVILGLGTLMRYVR